MISCKMCEYIEFGITNTDVYNTILYTNNYAMYVDGERGACIHYVVFSFNEHTVQYNKNGYCTFEWITISVRILFNSTVDTCDYIYTEKTILFGSKMLGCHT